ncbi:MAG: hypothetical protein JSS86_09680 [Cyanobacteria bacterium SZAS LIN-2]|nr:hypothetical protein [Cyanobacteria bacterium SZAS LIN-2]
MWNRLTENIQLPKITHRSIHFIQNMIVGAMLAIAFAFVSRFLHDAVNLLALASVALWAVYHDDSEDIVAILTALALSFAYLLLSQPMNFVAASVALGVYFSWLAFSRDLSEKLPPQISLTQTCLLQAALSLFLLLAIPAALIGFYYEVLCSIVLPTIAPYLVWFNHHLGPPAGALGAIIIVGLASWRQEADEESWYWLATPAMAVFFAFFFLPQHSTIGAIAVVTVGVVLSIVAFFYRPTWDTTRKSWRTLQAVTLTGTGFIAWFAIANNWEWFHQYEAAQVINIKVIPKLPATINNRLLPHISAPDYCTQGNGRGTTIVSNFARPMYINLDGELNFFWQCERYPSRFAGHVLTWPGTGIEGVIMADGGGPGQFAAPVKVNFPLGEESPLIKGVFTLRHPWSEMDRSIIGRTDAGTYYLLIPYTSWGLQWGGMVREFSGVMVVSKNGLIEDMTPQAAARMFPGIPLYPTKLAREYARHWASNGDIYEKEWQGNVLELSDRDDPDDTHYPTWQAFKDGVWGVIPFETKGDHQTQLRAIGLVDPVTGDMKVYFPETSESGDLTRAAEQKNLPGPKQILSMVSRSHPGMNAVKLVDGLLIVSESGQIYWNTALLQTNVQLNHGYAFNPIYDGHGVFLGDARSRQDIDRIITQHEKGVAEAAKQRSPKK